MKSIPVVITYYDSTKVVQGYPVKIGVLEGVFAATPFAGSFFDDEYVITHLATGLAVPGVRERTVAKAVAEAEKRIFEMGQERYQAAVLRSLKKWGPRIAKAYADLENAK